MHHGLCIVSTPEGYYQTVRIGWLRHVGEDVWEMIDSRILKRYGGNGSWAELSVKGPFEDTILLAPCTELIHILQLQRCVICDPKVWAKDCPMPEGWT